MTKNDDRRKHHRMPLKMSVLCQKVGFSDGKLYAGSTVNVSPGGMLVEVNNSKLRDGELVSVEMTVPPTEGLLENGGSFTSYARIVRVDGEQVPAPSCGTPANAVAIEFCESPKLRL